MPLTIPIIGGSEDGRVPVRYHSYGAIEVVSRDRTSAYSGLDVEGATRTSEIGAVDISGDSRHNIIQALEVVNKDKISKRIAALDISTGDSFLLLIDVIADAFSSETLAANGYLDINARLKINGSEVAIISFNYQEPPGKLGSLLNVRLADADVTLVPAGASITFDLVIETADGPVVYNLMSNAKLQERDYKIAYRGGVNGGPVDEITFGAIDIIADKFSLAPRFPVTMYDPNRVKYDQVDVKIEDCAREYPSGAIIMPIIEPVFGLTMKQVLDRAYTARGAFLGVLGVGYLASSAGFLSQIIQTSTNQTGCGFSRVITNIVDYPVRRADWSIEGTWHDGAQPVVAMYSPVYFVIGTVLYIIDPDTPLPYSASMYTIPLSEHKALSLRQEFKPDINAVEVTYQYSANDPSEDLQKESRPVFTDKVEETGTEGVAGYSRVTTRKWSVEWFLPTEPANVLASYDTSVETTIEQTIIWAIRDPDDGSTVDTVENGRRVTHFERIEYTYEGELKVGHERETQAAIAIDVDQRVQLITVEHESMTCTWTDDPVRPGVKIQDTVRIDVMGRCYIDNGPETMFEESGDLEIARKFTVMDAQVSGVVETDMELTDLIPTKTIRQTLRRVSGSQVDMEVVTIDHINNVVSRTYTDPVTGDATTDPFATRSRTLRLRDLPSEADIGPRPPLAVNAYELPRVRAIQLGQKVMARLKNPFMTFPVDLPDPNFSLGRGSVSRGQTRTGFTTNFFVLGRTINGESLGKRGHRISESLETVELLTP